MRRSFLLFHLHRTWVVGTGTSYYFEITSVTDLTSYLTARFKRRDRTERFRVVRQYEVPAIHRHYKLQLHCCFLILQQS